MKLKPLAITVAALVAASVFVWFLRRPAPPPTLDPRANQAVLTPSLAAEARGVTISDQGKTTELTRDADGRWRVKSYHDFPADFAKLSQLINGLTEAKIQRLVTTRADRLERLEFKDARVALSDQNGKTTWSVTLGKNADSGGRYLRYGDEQKGYLANLSTYLDSEPKNWADATLLKLKADDIAKVEINFTDGDPLIVSREKSGDAWTPANTRENHELDPGKVTSLLGNFGNLRFNDTVALDAPKVAEARPHSRTIKLTTFSNETFTITFSRKPEEKKLKAPAEAPAGDNADNAPEQENKPTEPEYETIPAGPVFVAITSSQPNAEINALMQKRAFQIYDWIFTGLPQKADEFWRAKPTPEPQSP